MRDLLDGDATAVAEAVRGRAARASAVVEQALGRVRERDRELGAFLSLEDERALRLAEAVDQRLAAGADLPLAGVPIALKANLCLSEAVTSCGSRMLAGWRAPYDGTAVERLLAAGAVPIGMTNMDEFAMGSSTENSAFGPTRNPWDTSRAPGGSSGGSAAAVASGMVPLALGSDTGGSVRQPAAFCGIAGFKPTYGRISRHGLVAFGSSLDQVSPLARSVRDLELALEVMSGADPLDASCLGLPPLATGPRAESLEGLRIGLPAECFSADLDPRVRERVERATAQLAELGAELVPLSLPHSRYAIPTYYVLATAEASSNLARYDGVRYGLRERGDGSLPGMIAATRDAGFGPEVKRRILLGTYVLSAGYREAWFLRAARVRRRILEDYERAFESVDLIAGPTAPTPAFPLGAKSADPIAMYLADVLTVPASLAGLPAISLPCGTVEEEGRPLPVGLHLVGRALEDARVLRVARLYEEHGPRIGLPALSQQGGRP